MLATSLLLLVWLCVGGGFPMLYVFLLETTGGGAEEGYVLGGDSHSLV